MGNNSKLKICHIASADMTVRFLLLPQLKFLTKEGYEVFCVCSKGKWKKEIEAEGTKVKNIKITRSITPFSDLLTLLRLFLYFRKENFDIVHTHTPKPGLLGQMAARMAGVPIVVNTIHGLYFGNKFSKAKKDFYIFMEKVSALFSDLILSQNKEDIKTLRENKISNLEKIKYLGNGVDTKKFNKENFSEEFLQKKRADIGIKEDFKVIGAVGRLVKEKGYFELFSAFEKVLKLYPKIVLLVVGPEDKEKKDSFGREVLKNYGIEKNVIFLGERTDLDEIYPLMDIFVLASHREGFPRTVIEAMSEGVPVISTDIRGCREIIENKKDGILIPLEALDELAKQIIYLLENPQIAFKMAKSARVKAEIEFDESSVFLKIKESYKDLVLKKVKAKKQTYLITGGAGFVGSHLSENLINSGNKVIIIDDLSSGLRSNLNKKAKFFQINVLDKKLRDVFKKEKPDFVFHLAGPIGLRKESGKDFRENAEFVKGFENLLNCSLEFKIKKFIFLSSGGAICADSKIIPTPETAEVNPESLYGKACLFLETKLAEYSLKGLDFAVLRFPNIYGPGQWNSGVMPSFIKQARENKVITINGDGYQTRDFIYIEDAVLALLAVLKHGKNGIWNVGSGTETSLRELADNIFKILKINPNIKYLNEFAQAKRSALDSSKMKNDFAWEPKISLQEGIEKTVGFYQYPQIKTCHVTTVDITARFIIFDFLKFLKSQGHGVNMLCSFSKWKEFIEKENIVTKDIKMTRRITPFSDLISFLKLYFYFKKENFDIVHTYTPKAGVLGRIAARLAGTPVVIHTSYGFYMGVKIKNWQRILIMLAEKLASLFCDLVFSQNKEDIEWAINKKIIAKDKIKLLTYGIDVNRFNPGRFPKDFIENKKKDLGISGKKVIGTVGRFVAEKGYEDLFKAFLIIKKSIPEAVLLLVAPKDKEKKDALDISILKDFGIEKETYVLGYENEVSNIEEFYPLMDIFVLPSYREGFPYSIMEASASGKAVVASNIRGCREAVEDNKTGLLFPVGDYKKLAETIIYLINNEDKLKEMGESGRKRAVRDFDQRVIFDIIKEEYGNLLNEKKR